MYFVVFAINYALFHYKFDVYNPFLNFFGDTDYCFNDNNILVYYYAIWEVGYKILQKSF